MEALLGIAFIVLVTRFAWHQLEQRGSKGSSKRTTSSRGIASGVKRGREWAARRTAGTAVRQPARPAAEGTTITTGPWQRARNLARKWGDYEIRKAEERAGRPSRARLAGRRMLAPVVATFADPAEGNGHPRDELAPRREQKNAARQDSSPSPAGPPPSANGRTPGVSSTTTQAGGASADLFTAVQQVMSQARAGGLKAKHRAVKALTEMHDYISQAETSLAQEMSEPDSDYPPQIWEPIAQTAAHSKAASMKMAESDSAMTALENMSVGDLAGSSVHAPHHDELNADA
jgi:hypothetical protein